MQTPAARTNDEYVYATPARADASAVAASFIPAVHTQHSAAGASATPSAPKRPSSDLPSGPSAPQQAAAPTVPGVAAVGAAGRGRLLRRNSSSLPCTYESEILQQGLATAGGQSFTAPAPLASALLRSASNASTAVSGKGGLPQAAASGAVQGSGGSFSSVHTSGDSFSSGARIRRGSTGSYGFPRHAAAATATDATMHASDDSDEASSPKVRTPALQGDIAELASRMGAAEVRFRARAHKHTWDP